MNYKQGILFGSVSTCLSSYNRGYFNRISLVFAYAHNKNIRAIPSDSVLFYSPMIHPLCFPFTMT